MKSSRDIPGASNGQDRIAIVIINYNTRQQLLHCLRSVDGQSNEVVVVDNGSTDGSLEMVRAEFPRVAICVSGENRGYGAAANLGIRASHADYILLLNSDTVLEPGAPQVLAAFLDSHPDAGLVGPRLLNPDGSLQRSTFPFPAPFDIFLDTANLARVVGLIPVLNERYLRAWSHSQPRPVPWVSGAALAIRRAAFDAVLGFDESFFMYFEETDLCYRLALAGWETWFAPVTEIIHVGGASTRQRRGEMTVEFYKSLRRLYAHHCSSLQSAEMVALVKLVALARLVRDSLAYYLERRSGQAWLAQNISAWRQLVRGDWQVIAK